MFIFTGLGTTAKTAYYIDWMQSPSSELNFSFISLYKPNKIISFQGSYIGIVDDGYNNLFKHYQFPDILYGDSKRILNILIPDHSIQRNPSEKFSTLNSVYKNSSSEKQRPFVSSIHFRALLFETAEQKPEINRALLFTRHPYDYIAKNEDHVDILKMRIEYYYLYRSSLSKYITKDSGKLKHDKDFRLIMDFDRVKYTEKDIWKKRLEYLYTIPLDLTTYPLQIIVAGMLVPMGGM
jgi:hypothetical protein